LFDIDYVEHFPYTARMAMGKRKRKSLQQNMWVATQDLPRSASHPFYGRLNRVLEKADFDSYVERLCAPFYAETIGRPSLPPGRYFRLLMVGYFEGLDSERGMAWRAADSLSLRQFLGLELNEAPPDHSTISRTRRLIDVETHQAVFTWILERLAAAGLVKGNTVGIDATTLEANAALRSLVRRDTGESYEGFLTGLATASGIATPTRADLARIDRKRPKKGSNDDWTHPHDPDSRITKMKDGTTHLAHKAEHAVDLETGAVVAVTVQPADEGDTKTIEATLTTAAENVEKARPESDGIQEFVADKGYHSNQVLQDLTELNIRTYISEPDRGRRNWQGKEAARQAVYGNRRRIRGARGQRLLRQRGERLERPFAHAYATGRMRRLYLRGRSNILKRILIHTAALNLGLLMRALVGVGTPRSLQGRLQALVACLFVLWRCFTEHTRRSGVRLSFECVRLILFCSGHLYLTGSRKTVFTTGC
jgi:transposase